MVNKFSSLGLCISSNLVDEIQSATRKTYASNIVLKKQCVQTHYLKICLSQQLLIALTIKRHPAHHLVIFMERACFNITII